MAQENLQALQQEISHLEELMEDIQERLAVLSSEVRLGMQSLMDERNQLRWRVDPYSSDTESLADW
ncbi:MAG: hypothetical protein ACO30S_07385 [Flavobacteriaceae bacterium]